jgi:hypothetical protein
MKLDEFMSGLHFTLNTDVVIERLALILYVRLVQGSYLIPYSVGAGIAQSV